METELPLFWCICRRGQVSEELNAERQWRRLILIKAPTLSSVVSEELNAERQWRLGCPTQSQNRSLVGQ